ncbi:putative secreted protein (Por secretion system target) [Neolewinella xylanilytica]|uniref:Putative secreted protein (Por secretion system target) n=1 Tax=Neolewinella xylanilytica TaxID=1514080 RepID=A0A2S6IA50_9BACT|nr:RICIN domain-containing protein [Neolewinella xylanilytica]PPK88352.1 putative secreted protein (Por secretion system target) [Neolewinella xylanilytica]
MRFNLYPKFLLDLMSGSRAPAPRPTLPLLLLALLLSTAAAAQSTKLFRPADSPELERRVGDRDADLTAFALLTLDETEALRLLGDRPPTLSVALPDPRGRGTLDLELARFELLGPGFQIVEMPANVVVTDQPESVFYRGEVAGREGSVAVLSIIDGAVTGLVSLPGESGELNLVRLEDEAAYLFYDDLQIEDKFPDLDCEVRAPGGGQPPVDKSKPEGVVGKVDGCFGIYLDIGQEVYAERGSSNAAVSFLLAAFAQVATLYANEDIDLTVSGTTVWTTREPFYKNLDRYRAHRAADNADGSVAHYVHRGGSGGVAYLNVLCNENYGYGLSGIDNSYRAVPNYSWTVFVLAHELGHNFGSEHTHDCAWNGNNTPLDNCASMNGGCATTDFIPQDGGTIMSYCHIKGVGINFSKGFGEQPGDRIRSRAAAANCTGYDCGTGTGGGDDDDDVAILPDGQYYLTARHSGKQLRIEAGQKNNGASVVQHVSRDLRSQKWNLVHLGDDVYRLINEHTGKALEVLAGSAENGANIVNWSYAGDSHQRWLIESVGDGYYHLRARHTDKCVNISGSSTANGGNAIQWSCTLGTNDDFRFEAVSAALVTDAPQRMALSLYPNPTDGAVHLELRLNADLENGLVTLTDVRGRTLEQWPFQALPGTHELDFDLSGRPAGMYVVRVRAGAESVSHRLVKTE